MAANSSMSDSETQRRLESANHTQLNHQRPAAASKALNVQQRRQLSFILATLIALIIEALLIGSWWLRCYPLRIDNKTRG